MNLARLHLSTPWLRRVLAVDAASGAALAALHLAFAPALAAGFGLPAGLLTAAGLALLAFVALAAVLARQPLPARGALLLLIVGNLVWGAACLALALGGAGITPLGQGYLTLMAVAVWGQLHGIVSLALEGQIPHTVLSEHEVEDVVAFAVEQMIVS